MVPSASSKGNAPELERDEHNGLDQGVSEKLQDGSGGPRPQQLIDIPCRRQTAAGAKGPATERRGRICIRENHFDVARRPPEAPGRKGTPKHVAGPGRVHAFDGEGEGPNLTAAASREAAVRTKRHADKRGAVFALHRLQGSSQIHVPGQRGWQLLRSNDRVDFGKKLLRSRLHVFDVDDGRNPCLTGRHCSCGGRRNVVTIDKQQAA